MLEYNHTREERHGLHSSYLGKDDTMDDGGRGRKDDGGGGKRKRDENDKAATKSYDVTDEEGAATFDGEDTATATTIPLLVPTKTEDGGRDEQKQEQDQGDHQSHDQSQGQGETTASNRPDLFQLYSDTDTRMLSLLGIDPPADPNDAEQQQDWRQLTGFQGIGEERRRRNSGERRTRFSTELHISAFENLWVQRGELDGPPLPLQGQPPRPRQQEDDNEGVDGP